MLEIDPRNFQISFHKTLRPQVLKAFQKKVDNESYITDGISGERVLTHEGEEIQVKDFGGILKGSLVFVKSDLISLVSYLSSKNNGNK